MTKRIGSLVAAVALVLAITGDSQAGENRGWIFGGGVTSGRLSFANREGRGVALGPVDGYTVLPYGGPLLERRDLDVFDPSTPPPPDADRAVLFPKSAGGAGLTIHLGYAFSPRLAALADLEFIAPYTEGFTQVVGAVVVRYSPSSRLWLEAGPATSDLGYAYEGGTAGDGNIQGAGVMAAAGVNVVRKPKWTIGLQARYSRLWYDGFQTSSLSFGVSAGRVCSGKARGENAAAVR